MSHPVGKDKKRGAQQLGEDTVAEMGWHGLGETLICTH